jgi:regulatory protein
MAEQNRRKAFDALKQAVENPEEVIQVAEREPDAGQESLRDEAAHRAFRQAYDRAVRYLGQREHSEKELLAKLRARDTDATLARQVLAELKALDLQSDQRFAESLVRSRVGRGKGPLVIRQELGRKGIDDDLVEEVLTLSGDYWIEIAVSAREKRFGPQPPEDRGEWSRQARFLARRGFPSDLIYRVLGNLG